MYINIELMARVITELPDSEVLALRHMCTNESFRRHMSQFTLEATINKGGDAQMVTHNRAHDPTIDQLFLDQLFIKGCKPKYALSDMPEGTTYCDTCGEFVYILTGNSADKFRTMVVNEVGIPVPGSGDLKFFFDPELEHFSKVVVRSETSPRVTPLTRAYTLKYVVEWINTELAEEAKRLPDIIPLVPVVFGENSSLMQEFKGESIVMELPLGGETYKVAPVKIGHAINMYETSNLGGLIASGRIPETSEPTKHMEVKSLYIRVGNHLVRMMLSTGPQSVFCPSVDHNQSSLMVDFKAQIILRKGDLDAFSTAYDFMELAEDGDNITITVRVKGTFNSVLGNLIFESCSDVIEANGSNTIKQLARMISSSVKVLAVEPVGRIQVM